MNTWLKTKLPSVDLILERLKKIYPREIDENGYIRREIGAKTIFVMLYGFCVDAERWLRPATVTVMSDAQALKTTEKDRREWIDMYQDRKSNIKDVVGRWYMPNTRECIRDETLRALVRLNAVIERPLTTTSPLPRYSLQNDFTALFNPDLSGDSLEDEIRKWRENNLTKKALARVALSKKMVSGQDSGVLVHLPNGETRKLSPGPSSELIKAVVEQFSHKYMRDPAVVLISESARKLTLKDDELCHAIGFDVDVSTVLPDIILADLGVDPPLIIFCECVATDGPINDRRKQELIEMARKAGYADGDYAFVTVFNDRAGQTNRRLSHCVALGTVIWYASEPNSLVVLREGSRAVFPLSDMLDFIR